MKNENKQREEKYPILFNHLKTIKGITEEEREKCLYDFYNMDEKKADIKNFKNIVAAFEWYNTINGSEFWCDIFDRVREFERKS